MTRTMSTLSPMERVLFLRDVPLFAALPPQDLQPIAAIATEHAYEDGDTISVQGEPGEEMHIIVSGEVAVSMRDAAGDERVVAVRSQGEAVGEMAVITHEPRVATLLARGSVRVLTIAKPQFEAILRERPDTAIGGSMLSRRSGLGERLARNGAGAARSGAGVLPRCWPLDRVLRPSGSRCVIGCGRSEPASDIDEASELSPLRQRGDPGRLFVTAAVAESAPVASATCTPIAPVGEPRSWRCSTSALHRCASAVARPYDEEAVSRVVRDRAAVPRTGPEHLTRASEGGPPRRRADRRRRSVDFDLVAMNPRRRARGHRPRQSSATRRVTTSRSGAPTRSKPDRAAFSSRTAALVAERAAHARPVLAIRRLSCMGP